MSHLTVTPSETGKEQGIAIDTHKNPLVITIPRSAVEERSGSGDHLDVVRVDIVDNTGKSVGRFWVDVHLGRQQRPVLHIATNVGEGTNTKKLVGSWRPASRIHSYSLGD